MGGHITIIGCGNIGAALCDLLARQPEVSRLTLIDSDIYTAENLRGQAVSRAEVGVPKVRAQARRLKRIRPELRIDAHCAAVESLPPGLLRSDVLCACVDSRISRMHINEMAWKLGIPWIDAGVLASEMLARIEVFVPGCDAPCLECAFGEQHYATLETRHPCQKGNVSAAPTNAPAYLGALAASLQAAECHKLLRGGRESLMAGEQVIYGLRSRQQFVSRNRRNPNCRFDHRVCVRQEIPASLDLEGLLFPTGAKEADCVLLSVVGQRFLQAEACSQCGRRGPARAFIRNDAGLERNCPRCGTTLPAHPGRLHERLRADAIPRSLLKQTPHALGLRPGDLLIVEDGEGARSYLLGPRLKGRRRD